MLVIIQDWNKPYLIMCVGKKNSLELISPTYQLWYNIFLSQQNNISRLISRRNHQSNGF